MFLHKRKAQSTAEYAIIIAIVVGAAVAMQVYVKRGLQGRIAASTDRFTDALQDPVSYGSSAWKELYAGTEKTPNDIQEKYEPTDLQALSTRKADSSTTEAIAKGEDGKVSRVIDETTQANQEKTHDYRQYNY